MCVEFRGPKLCRMFQGGGCGDIFFFKQKTAYEMRISDWSSDVCSSDLNPVRNEGADRSPTAGPFTHGPRGLIRGDVDNSQEFNAERLDNLDYWVAQLKKNGIYVNFNLNVGRRFKAGDGVPDPDFLGPAKGFTYIGPEPLPKPNRGRLG